MSEAIQFVLMSAGAFVLAAIIIAAIVWAVLMVTIFSPAESARNLDTLHRHR